MANLRETLIRPFPLVSARHLAWNPAWLLLARLVVQAQGMLLAILVARRLGDAGFGQYAWITALIFAGNVFTSFGTDTLLVRQVAQGRRVEIPEVPAALVLQLALSAGTVVAIWLWTLLFTQKSAEIAASLRLYSLSLLPLAFFSVFSALLRGLERMDLYLVANLGTAAVQLTAVWLALRAGGSLLPLMAALLAGQGFAMLFGYALCRRATPGYRLGWRLEIPWLARLLKAAWPLAALATLGVLYQRLGIFALSALAGEAQTGLFSAAARVVEASKIGHLAVLGALLPALARLHGRPQTGEAGRRLFHRSAWGLLGLGLLEALGIFFIAAPLVSLLYGVRFAAAAPALRILCWILLPYSLSSTLAVDLVVRKKERAVATALLLGLVATALLHLLWIPRWGVLGACLAAIAGEVALAGGLWRLRNGYDRRN